MSDLIQEVKMQQVTPVQLESLLVGAIASDPPQNVLVVGGPGIGKSEITEQAAAKAGAEIIRSHPAVEDPTVPAGLPWVNAKDEFATFKPFGNLYRAMKATTRTVWNLEDFGQAPGAVQAGYMQLLQAKEVNGHKLPADLISFVVTTNRRTDRSGVVGILEAVKSRFMTIVELVVSVPDWVDWAVRKPWMSPMVIAYIRFKNEALYQFDPSADLVNCPLPRTWAAASRILNIGYGKEVERAALAGAVGEGEARGFLSFRDMFNQLPAIEEILKNPTTAPVPDNPGPLYAIATTLAAKTTKDNFGAVATYVQRMVDKGYGDFGSLLIRDAVRRTPTLQQTDSFVTLYTGEVGQLLTGIAA